MSPAATENDFVDALESRASSLQAFFGSDFMVGMSLLPSFFGGGTDIAEFDRKEQGAIVVTHGLTGNWGSEQVRNSLGECEFAVCLRHRPAWATKSKAAAPLQSADNEEDPLELGHEVLQVMAAMSESNCLEPHDTVGPLPRKLRPLESVLLWPMTGDARRFEVCGEPCGILLCVGITKKERKYAKKHGAEALIVRLKKSGVFPYTDPKRRSAI